MLSVSWYRSIRWFTKQVTTRHNKHSYMWSNVFCKKQVIFISAATCINELFICFYIYRFNFTWRVFKIYQVAPVNAVLFEKQKFQIEVLSGISLVFSVVLKLFICVLYIKWKARIMGTALVENVCVLLSSPELRVTAKRLMKVAGIITG